jgi:mannosyltransferase OCH1-like enzyme
MQSPIPKRIIQTGPSLDVPLRIRAMMSSVRFAHPDFEYRFFDDAQVDDFLNREFPEYGEVIAGFPRRIQKYDFFRYLVVYRLGGFYLDTDILVAESFAGLLDGGCVFSFEDLNMSPFLRDEYGMDWAIGNYAFGSLPGHPFLKAVIDNCVRAQTDAGWAMPMLRGIPWLVHSEFTVLNTTGPLLLSRTFAENPQLASTLRILFPDDVCDPRNRHQFGNYAIHLMDASWRVKRGFVRRRLVQLCESWHYRKLWKKSVKLGRTRPVMFSDHPQDPLRFTKSTRA